LMLGTTDGQMIVATNATTKPGCQATSLATNGGAGLTKVITH